MLIVKAFLHHSSRERFLSNLYFEFVAQLSVLAINESHTHALVYRDAVVSSGYFAHFNAVFHHVVAVSRYGFILQFNAHHFLFYAVGLLFCHSLFADKLFFIEFTEHAKASHYRRNIVA